MNKMIAGLFLVLGLAVGYFAHGFMGGSQSTVSMADSKSNEPLYWVAPMDPNYRRDKPGKSPMGMDLIPVYEEDDSAEGEGPGTVTISPAVENNLGVRIESARKQALNTAIHTVGYVQYNQDQLIHIHPRVEGWIEKLYIKAEGDQAKQGQPLYELYSPALVNAQEEYVLALDRNNQRLIQAAENRLSALQLPDETIGKLKTNRKVQQNITVLSPQSGVVDNLNIREGFFVNPGTTVMSIGNLDEVWVEAEVLERQAAMVNVGATVIMTLDYLPGEIWHGKVDYVYPTLDEKTRSVKVRMRFQNHDHKLKPNMFVQITIESQSTEPAVLIPREALIRTGKSDRVVLALGNGKFKSVEVKTGRFDDENFEILKGVSEGEQVVVSAQFLLDSESSKTSDFKRMQDLEWEDKNIAQVMGVINSIDLENRLLNISREAITKWNRGPATLDFNVEPHIDLSTLKDNQSIHFEFYISDQHEFVIRELHVMESMSEKTDQHGVTNHD